MRITRCWKVIVKKANDMKWPAWTRALSLALAGFPYLLLFAYPYAIGNPLSRLDHMVLPVVLLASAGGFAFGLGFHFKHNWLALLSSPPVTWSVILLGFSIMLSD